MYDFLSRQALSLHWGSTFELFLYYYFIWSWKVSWENIHHCLHGDWWIVDKMMRWEFKKIKNMCFFFGFTATIVSGESPDKRTKHQYRDLRNLEHGIGNWNLEHNMCITYKLITKFLQQAIIYIPRSVAKGMFYVCRTLYSLHQTTSVKSLWYDKQFIYHQDNRHTNKTLCFCEISYSYLTYKRVALGKPSLG